MCDFYSENIKFDGTRFHRPHNSHSRMAEEAKWGENLPNREQVYWEFEWNPWTPLKGTGLRGENPPEKVLEAALKTVEELEAAKLGRFALRWQGDHGVDVRQHVARNPNTLPESLATLTHDTDAWVRQCVALNPNTLPESLAALIHDTDAWVRWYVAQNPNTPKT